MCRLSLYIYLSYKTILIYNIRKYVRKRRKTMNSVIITAIICATLIILSWMGGRKK